MGSGKRQNALLIEIIIAVMFFALSATVILEVFSTAYGQSLYAKACSGAVSEAQNLAERFSASNAPEALLEDEGFAKDGEAWVRELDDFTLEVKLTEEKTAAGQIYEAEIAALREDEVLVTLPCALYVPLEVAR